MSAAPEANSAIWIRSSYSDGSGGQCVEFCPSFAGAGVIPVRDSKDPHGPVLTFPADGWAGFLSTLRADGPAAA
ncbi:DUF397 domain-containing protein [Streptomyces aidingensis]|uniref:DUF397 domain-containing protein n=1 Tax=Streptomyces aidingensis TaxID=910347 RepID=A0A1I1GRL9_9ACTN|nr:DUF397 domain-containing protein [Streptomyces aidingensis]SFC14131.1 protein of unknown function [Streptomyces aidingensis]